MPTKKSDAELTPAERRAKRAKQKLANERRAQKVSGDADTGPTDRKIIQARIDHAGWSALSSFAKKRTISLEALIVEALNDYLRRHRQGVIVERRRAADPTEHGPAVKTGRAIDTGPAQKSLPLGAPKKLVGRRSASP